MTLNCQSRAAGSGHFGPHNENTAWMYVVECMLFPVQPVAKYCCFSLSAGIRCRCIYYSWFSVPALHFDEHDSKCKSVHRAFCTHAFCAMICTLYSKLDFEQRKQMSSHMRLGVRNGRWDEQMTTSCSDHTLSHGLAQPDTTPLPEEAIPVAWERLILGCHLFWAVHCRQ